MNHDKEAIKTISESVGKQLLNLNPITGFIVSYVETVKERQAERKLTRCLEMLESLQKDLDDSQKSINEKYVKNDDFLDIFEQMNILSRLEKDDLTILKVLYQPELANKAKGYVLKNPNLENGKRSESYRIERNYDLVWTLKDLLQINEEQIKDSLYALTRERLVNDNTLSFSLKTDGNPVDVLKNHLTPKGKSFISYLLKD